jgi:hypothetical protein
MHDQAVPFSLVRQALQHNAQSALELDIVVLATRLEQQ